MSCKSEVARVQPGCCCLICAEQDGTGRGNISELLWSVGEKEKEQEEVRGEEGNKEMLLKKVYV